MDFSLFPRDFKRVSWKTFPNIMKNFILSCLFGASVGLLAGCSNTTSSTSADNSQQSSSSTPAAAASAPAAQPNASAPAAADEVAVIKTTDGDMVIQFWPDAAPKTVANFKKLARSGFYDGTCFHRVIKDFMIQGGDPLTKDPSAEDRWGTGGPGYTVDAEFNDHSHVRGVISMARSSDPNSAGSQFFICHGNPTQLDHQYTAFGHLIKGDDVLEKIATTPTHPPDRPDKRVDITSITIVPASSIQ
jgi:peptidyl-prolyl cis-trans isomerase B (cyclophilin B)